MRTIALALATAVTLAGCGARDAPPETAAPATDWRALATAADRARLREWRTSWTTALARARQAGYGAQIDAGGALFAPDAALAGPEPAPGDYRCRVIKLGARTVGNLDYVAYPFFACRITREAGRFGFVKLTGSQRPTGLLHPTAGPRLIFLGTMALGDETRAIPYARDPERDLAGAFERIGPRRWRLALPAPRWESLLDIYEIVPAG